MKKYFTELSTAVYSGLVQHTLNLGSGIGVVCAQASESELHKP
jgi:hypothetical protein